VRLPAGRQVYQFRHSSPCNYFRFKKEESKGVKETKKLRTKKLREMFQNFEFNVWYVRIILCLRVKIMDDRCLFL